MLYSVIGGIWKLSDNITVLNINHGTALDISNNEFPSNTEKIDAVKRRGQYFAHTQGGRHVVCTYSCMEWILNGRVTTGPSYTIFSHWSRSNDWTHYFWEITSTASGKIHEFYWLILYVLLIHLPSQLTFTPRLVFGTSSHVSSNLVVELLK